VTHGFEIVSQLDQARGRTGVITTPHGEIQTPAFIPVGTKGTVKSVLPESVRDLGAQAVLANAYHLYLQPGTEIIDAAGGLGTFMNWPLPTFTDSGGFQVLSLGVGFKKVLSMDSANTVESDVIAPGKDRLAHVDDEGVTFKSHLDGSMHRFTAEVSMQVQHAIGADIIFAFDECTTLMNSKEYQILAMRRTLEWAQRCIDEHERLTRERSTKPYQMLFGVIQGAHYEDLRRKAAREIGELDFDGFGIGGAMDKETLGTIIGWVVDELPENKPRHLLGIGEPLDLFVGIENGADTFDCVAPTRNARNSALLTVEGRFNVSNAYSRGNNEPVDSECDCYTCINYSQGYLHHAYKGNELIFPTLASIHNLRFTVSLVDQIREHMQAGTYFEFKRDWVERFTTGRYAKKN
jgi:queuine tRNA-ribosyltransferase